MKAIFAALIVVFGFSAAMATENSKTGKTESNMGQTNVAEEGVEDASAKEKEGASSSEGSK